MAALYDLIGAPPKTKGEIVKEAMARRTAKMLGSRALRRHGRKKHWKQDAMIKVLKNLLAKHRYLSVSLIRADPFPAVRHHHH
jgi:hypothetical protein